MQDDEFEWHDEKAARNAKVHGITFEVAQEVFQDPCAIMDEDTDASWTEDRYRIVGHADGRVLVLSYTYRGDVIRLISARRATRREQDEYYRSQTPP